MNDSNFKIITERDSYKKTKLGSITGKIYVCLDEYYFPEKGWFDFALVVVTWWQDSTIKIFKSESKREKFMFMDGPFYISVEKGENDSLGLSFIEWSNRRIIEKTGNIKYELLISELIKTSDDVINECKRNNWLSDDYYKCCNLNVELRSLAERNPR